MSRVDWFNQELEESGFEVTEQDINSILNGDASQYNPALVDIVLELDREWGED